jgi:hypothetical protein
MRAGIWQCGDKCVQFHKLRAVYARRWRAYNANMTDKLINAWTKPPTKWYPLPLAIGALLLVIQYRKTNEAVEGSAHWWGWNGGYQVGIGLNHKFGLHLHPAVIIPTILANLAFSQPLPLPSLLSSLKVSSSLLLQMPAVRQVIFSMALFPTHWHLVTDFELWGSNSLHGWMQTWSSIWVPPDHM